MDRIDSEALAQGIRAFFIARNEQNMKELRELLAEKLKEAAQICYDAAVYRDEDGDVDIMRTGYSTGIVQQIASEIHNDIKGLFIQSFETEVFTAYLCNARDCMNASISAARNDDDEVDLLKLGWYLGKCYQLLRICVDMLLSEDLKYFREKTTDQLKAEAKVISKPEPIVTAPIEEKLISLE